MSPSNNEDEISDSYLDEIKDDPLRKGNENFKANVNWLLYDILGFEKNKRVHEKAIFGAGAIHIDRKQKDDARILAEIQLKKEQEECKKRLDRERIDKEKIESDFKVFKKRVAIGVYLQFIEKIIFGLFMFCILGLFGILFLNISGNPTNLIIGTIFFFLIWVIWFLYYHYVYFKTGGD